MRNAWFYVVIPALAKALCFSRQNPPWKIRLAQTANLFGWNSATCQVNPLLHDEHLNPMFGSSGKTPRANLFW
jgi:hypothetical protein